MIGHPRPYLAVAGVLAVWACNSADGAWNSGDVPLNRSSGRHYYVRPAGRDDAPGDAADRAWRSVERVNRHGFQPGDRVSFEAGFGYAGNLVFDANDAGTGQAPVTIGSFGQGRATIEAGTGTGIRIADAGGLVVQHLALRGDWDAARQTGNEGHGVIAENTLGGGRRLKWLRFVDLDISGFKLSGISLHASPADDSKEGGFEDVEIADSAVHDNGQVGITTQGPFTHEDTYSHRGVFIRGVKAYQNRGIAHQGRHTGSGIELADVDGALIERCVAFDNGEYNDHTAGGGFGIWTWDSNAVVIQYNESYDNRSQTADGGGFDLDGGVTNSVVQYNYSHENHGAGYGALQFSGARPSARNLIRYNISQNDGMGFLLWDGNGDLGMFHIHNNVAYGSHAAVMTYSPILDAHLLNNVLSSNGATLLDVVEESGLRFEGNDYWTRAAPFHIVWNTATASPREYTSLAAFRTGTGQESRAGASLGLDSDPELRDPGAGPALGDASRLASLDMYETAADSPLIDRGVDLADYGIDPPRSDFFGSPTPQGAGIDIGVQER